MPKAEPGALRSALTCPVRAPAARRAAGATTPATTGMGWPGTVRLRFERWRLDLAAEGVRNVTLDGWPVLTSLYAAVRAPNWATLAEEDVRDQVEKTGSRVAVRRQGTVGGMFRSTLVVECGGAGLLRVWNALEVLADYDASRWGLNACIDAESWEGARAVTEHGEAMLPCGVAPQFRVDGVLQGVLPPAATLLLRAPAGRLRLTSRGQVIEVEDQRNWSEPTYKIYSGSLSQPHPLHLRAGDRMRQDLTVRYVPPRRRPPRERRGNLLLGAQRPLLHVGVQVNDSFQSDRREVADAAGFRAQVEAILVDHVRFDTSAEGSLPPSLLQAPGVPVELAALLDDLNASTVEGLVATCTALPRDSRVLLHLSRRRTTGEPEASRVAARLRSLRPDLAVVPGTDAYFADLARDALPLNTWVSFSIVPTVHLLHDESLFGTLRVQERLCQEVVNRGGLPVVSPVTLRLRGDPEGRHDAATRASTTTQHFDPRLRTIEGAAWALGSVVALVRGGAAAATWHELSGARGLVRESAGAPSVAPAFHVLAGLRARTRPVVRPVLFGSYAAAGLVFTEDRRLLLASLLPSPLEISLLGAYEKGQRLQRRRLRAADVAGRTLHWWRDAPVAEVRADVPMELDPFEVTELRPV